MTETNTCIGTFPNVALCDGRGIRTDNPTHSVVVFGDRERVEEFIKGDSETDTPTSPLGVYGKIFNQDGYVLLVGVGHDKNTSIHCIDEMLNLPNRLSNKPASMKVRYTDGSIKIRKFYYMISDVIEDVSAFYPKYQPAFEKIGAITYGKVGSANTQLCSAKKMESITREIRKRSNGIEIMSDNAPLKKEWYS